ncbi:fungal hydrophobin [Phanerochaete sordida]|uniref:Hydrophobin n=1 Tax=Phanerochaete sordida TaxID=48140 RepID=A0A9P3GGN8_9APHY|nr:fungal hydrophobin [Phanerochaete sordida]
MTAGSALRPRVERSRSDDEKRVCVRWSSYARTLCLVSPLALFLTVSLALLVGTTPVVKRNDTPTTACCASTQDAQSSAAVAILKVIGTDAGDISSLIGLTCSPISFVGVGSGSECSGTTVSCSNGVIGSIGVGCIPVST